MIQIVGLNEQARIMFQEARLLPWVSVLENVGVGLGLKKGWKERAVWALKQVGLEDRRMIGLVSCQVAKNNVSR